MTGKDGFVYLLGTTSDDGIYKIGVTRGSVDRRIRKLQTGNSGEIYLIKRYVSRFPFFVESSMHRLYSSKNVLNEWYKLSDEEVASFCDECKRFEDMAENLKDNPFFKYDKLR